MAFTILWLGALAWNAYWWLFRVASEMQIDGRCLRWSTPLRTLEVPFGELTEIRPMRLASNIQVFTLRDGRPVLVIATKGIRRFTEEISRRRPDLRIRLGWQARLAERLPGRSRFEP